LIYNKGKDLDWARLLNIGDKKSAHLEKLKSSTIHLENVGREGHTYLHHIIANYDHFDDDEHIVFLQGHPFDHSPDLFLQLKNIQARVKNSQKIDFEYLSKEKAKFTLDRCPFTGTRLPMRKIYQDLFGKTSDAEFEFGLGAQFVVSGKTIRRHEKAFYEKMRDLLSYDSNPIEGHVVERFWQLVFAGE
jgi:hypothetical protein